MCRYQPVRALCLLFAITNVSLLSAQGTPAGRITMALGDVSVLDAAGNPRPIDRGAGIYVGDRFVTGSDGIVQMRMADGAIVSLRCESRLSIDAYLFQGDPGDRAYLFLHAGGLRTITGTIAGGQYRLGTPLAELLTDAEGGDVRLSLDSASNQVVRVYDGRFRLLAPAGELVLGAGTAADFATLAAGQAPQGIALLPAPPASSCGTSSRIILQPGI